MNKKIIGLFFSVLLLIGALGFVSARNFEVFNATNPTQSYFFVNGTIGNFGGSLR